MADSIGNISGYGNYGVGGYYPQSNKHDVEGKEHQASTSENKQEYTQVDPSKVMEFLASHNFFVAPQTEAASTNEVDVETQDRIAGYMEQFEMIYGIVLEEFGEEVAPAVMDLVMDRLMSMT